MAKGSELRVELVGDRGCGVIGAGRVVEWVCRVAACRARVGVAEGDLAGRWWRVAWERWCRGVDIFDADFEANALVTPSVRVEYRARAASVAEMLGIDFFVFGEEFTPAAAEDDIGKDGWREVGESGEAKVRMDAKGVDDKRGWILEVADADCAPDRVVVLDI